MMGENKVALPPGFEFDPSDEELIIYFLRRRAAGLPCYPNIIPDLDLYAPNYPSHLKDKAFWSKKEWYFFSRKKERKKGFWKEVGVSEAIFRSSNGDDEVIGTKKYLVFYSQDQAPASASASHTNWIMEQYHLLPTSHQSDQNQDTSEWVLCRVREAKVVDFDEEKKMDGGDGVELSYLDEVFLSMDDDDQEEINFPT